MLVTLITTRRWISSTQLARLLANKHPTIDPRSVKESKLAALVGEVTDEKIKSKEVHAAWKTEYDTRMHDSAFDEMADPGEQCDGELPSWTRDRLSVEKDKNFNVPSVSAHEASTRLKQKK